MFLLFAIILIASMMEDSAGALCTDPSSNCAFNQSCNSHSGRDLRCFAKNLTWAQCMERCDPSAEQADLAEDVVVTWEWSCLPLQAGGRRLRPERLAVPP